MNIKKIVNRKEKLEKFAFLLNELRDAEQEVGKNYTNSEFHKIADKLGQKVYNEYKKLLINKRH